MRLFPLALTIVSMISLLAVTGSAKIVTRTVEYQDGNAVLEGYLAYDDATTARRPAVLVVHEWTGINDYTRSRTEQLAGLGYVAFAADIYGKGIRPQNMQEAAVQAGKYKGDRTLLRSRVNAGLDWLKSYNLTDTARVAAIGYCFGGTTVLELARSGAQLAGVVSFHGGLDSPNPADGKNIKCKVLVLHGADDPNVPPDQVAAFQKELRDAGVDWEMVYYGGAVHSFTNPASGNDNSRGAAYNASADRRSWIAMRDFFAEIFK